MSLLTFLFSFILYTTDEKFLLQNSVLQFHFIIPNFKVHRQILSIYFPFLITAKASRQEVTHVTHLPLSFLNQDEDADIFRKTNIKIVRSSRCHSTTPFLTEGDRLRSSWLGEVSVKLILHLDRECKSIFEVYLSLSCTWAMNFFLISKYLKQQTNKMSQTMHQKKLNSKNTWALQNTKSIQPAQHCGTAFLGLN